MITQRTGLTFSGKLIYILLSLLLIVPAFSNTAGAANSNPALQLKANGQVIGGAYRDSKYGVVAPYYDVFTAFGYKTTMKSNVITALAAKLKKRSQEMKKCPAGKNSL